MAISMPSSIALCPINFKLFDQISVQLKNVEAALLYSKIKFHQTNSKIKKDNRICIARSREQIASWFDFGLKKVDRLLTLLENHGLIKKTTGTWFGKKRLFISVSDIIEKAPINIKLLETLTQQTGSLKTSLLFSKIAFSFANTKIVHNGLHWCTINKQNLATWASCSIRTIDSLLENLLKSGLILKENFIYRGKIQSHFHIPEHVIESLTLSHTKTPPSKTEMTQTLDNKDQNKENDVVTHSQNCRSQPAKMTVSIRIRSKEKKTNNNTSEIVPTKRVGQSDINFSNIGTELSNRQTKYLEAALSRTIERRKIRISNPKELIHQLNFSILNSEQHVKTTTFQHTVSYFMKILGDGNWKTPIGFHNHSTIGQQLRSNQEDKLQQWQLQKEQECQQAKKQYQYLTKKNDALFHQVISDTVTEQAIQLAKQIRYCAERATKQETIDYVESMNKQLHGYLRQGADKTQVLACLRG